MWRECFNVVEKWFSEFWTQSESITKLNGRQLQQNEEWLRLGSLATFHKAFPHFAVFPHLQKCQSLTLAVSSTQRQNSEHCAVVPHTKASSATFWNNNYCIQQVQLSKDSTQYSRYWQHNIDISSSPFRGNFAKQQWWQLCDFHNTYQENIMFCLRFYNFLSINLAYATSVCSNKVTYLFTNLLIYLLRQIKNNNTSLFNDKPLHDVHDKSDELWIHG